MSIENNELKRGEHQQYFRELMEGTEDTLEAVEKAIQDGRADWEIVAYMGLTPEDGVAIFRTLLEQFTCNCCGRTKYGYCRTCDNDE